MTETKSHTADAAGTPFVYSGTELDAMSQAREYFRWILGHFAPYLGETVVEIGAGAGNFSEVLLAAERVRKLTCFEPARNLFPMLQG